MRSVFVFPALSRRQVEDRLDSLGERYEVVDGKFEWNIDDTLWARIRTECDGLYEDWGTEDVQLLSTAVGPLPSWAVIVDVSGRIPGRLEVTRFMQTMIEDGGYAMDDYSADVWTHRQITSGEVNRDGRHFFDHERG